MHGLPRAPLPQTSYARLRISVNKKRGQCTSPSCFPEMERIRVKIPNIPEMELTPCSGTGTAMAGAQRENSDWKANEIFKSKKCGGVINHIAA